MKLRTLLTNHNTTSTYIPRVHLLLSSSRESESNWLLQTLAFIGLRSSKKNSAGGLVVSLLVLMGGYFLRRTMVEAGHTSSQDARATLWNARR